MNRTDRLREQMKVNGWDAVIVSSEINQRYLSRYPFTDGLLLVTLYNAELLTDFRYYEDAQKKADPMYTVTKPDMRFPHIKEFFDRDRVKTVGNETVSSRVSLNILLSGSTRRSICCARSRTRGNLRTSQRRRTRQTPRYRIFLR